MTDSGYVLLASLQCIEKQPGTGWGLLQRNETGSWQEESLSHDATLLADPTKKKKDREKPSANANKMLVKSRPGGRSLDGAKPYLAARLEIPGTRISVLNWPICYVGHI